MAFHHCAARRQSIGSVRSSRMSVGGDDMRSRALDMMRANGGGHGGEEAPARTMSTAHLSGAVSPGKAARNPQELVAFLRAKRKSGGSQMMDAPTSSSPMQDFSQGPPPAPPPPMFAGGPPGPPPPLPPGGFQGGGDPMGAPNPLLSEIELAARARQDRVVVPQAGGYNPLLSEIENAARARQERVPVLQQNAGANPLLDQIRAAGGSPRGGGGGIDQWLQQSGGGTLPPNQAVPGAWQGQLVPEQQQDGADMRLGESAVSPTLTAQRSASPPPPSALSQQQRGTYNVVTQQYSNDGEPVNYVRELLMTHGLVNKPRTLMTQQQPGAPQEQEPQFDPNDHVSQLLMRHDFHTTKDVYSIAQQIHQEAQRPLPVPHWQQGQGTLPHSLLPPGAQGGPGQVPGMAPQQPQHSTIWEQLGQVQAQRMPERTASVYQGPMNGRSTFQVSLQKAVITPGGQPTFGMGLKWAPEHSRIEVTNVPPSESWPHYTELPLVHATAPLLSVFLSWSASLTFVCRAFSFQMVPLRRRWFRLGLT